MADERDESNLLPEDHISDEISERVRAVLSAAESAATAIRHESEQQAQQRRRAAEAERERFLENARGEAEALLAERMRRISELSDSIIEGAEGLLLRIEAAGEVKLQLESVLRELARAASHLAAESHTGTQPPATPKISSVEDPGAGASVTELRAAKAPEPEVETEPVVEEEPEAEEPEIVDATAEPEPEPETPEAAEPAHKPSPVERLRDAVRGENHSTEEKAEPAADKGPESHGFEGDEMLAARLVALQMAVAGSARGEVEQQLRKTFSLDDPAEILNDVFGAESKL
jgi:hypothetical protein